ncbi:site-2 protease family protein [Paenibacillus sp. JX-17]|uniref:Site-2 protease family protein n=1 Tax=Paenibacillus lacisoli TaxID=3064525 RepID=A0ABT9C8B1_9BACL|nr:site-2 protease family protein [Paenibacillus sp. JX-17]MDO7905475.1 site-2 protease family protein [Paenibacillus sp. JX-17]
MDFLDRFLQVPLANLPFYILALIFAFTVHEFSHAYFANKFGDPTAKLLGRVTLNPAVHIDFLGTLLLLIGGFGWAKPVPVNRANFTRPRLMGVIVSVAGPLSNLLLSVVGLFIFHLLNYFGVLEGIENQRVYMAVYYFFNYLVSLNMFLFLFNLIPLPPLDGYRIVEDLAPRSALPALQRYEQWSLFIFLLIVFIPALRNVTIVPIYEFANFLVRSFGQVFLHLF